jgi:8-oxo-dGTP diphosphatase
VDLSDALPDGQRLVVGAALVHEGRVLAARRTRPAEAAGWWELPGGKVDRGETLEDAVVREVAEELGCVVRATRVLPGVQPLAHGASLRVMVVELVDGEPVPHEHDAVWWLAPGDLGRVRWLAPDLPFLEQVREMLEAGDPRSRG